jgi:glutathione synthase/RimK-type ligase-like ATP-grasp enzyme
MIKIHKLTSNDIQDLSDSNTLYILDYRALGESFEYEIPSMWKYENLLPWIVNNGVCTVNENHTLLHYKNVNNNTKLFICNMNEKANKSIIMRADHILDMHPNINKIWTGVAHPEIDTFAQNNNLILNYDYKSFLQYNDKIDLKLKMEKLTPEWFIVNNIEELQNTWDTGKFIIKRSSGSGGYTNFMPTKKNIPDKLIDLFKEDNYRWYAELIIESQPQSIQCYKLGDDIFIYGMAHQIIENKTEFVGAEFLDIQVLKNDRYLYEKISQTIENIHSQIGNYQGFFGIDFFYSNEKYYFLEANIRLTSMTTPTLLHNDKYPETTKFCEDFDGNTSDIKLVLSHDSAWSTDDVLI